MKTLIFESADKSAKSEVKVDIFAKNSELIVVGFGTRFTQMQIVDTPDIVADVLGLSEIEKDWQACIALAEASGYNLSVVDINENDSSEVVSWGALAGGGTVAGTIGTKALVGTATTMQTDLSSGDKINIDGFTYTVDVVTNELNITVAEDLLTEIVGATVYLLA